MRSHLQSWSAVGPRGLQWGQAAAKEGWEVWGTPLCNWGTPAPILRCPLLPDHLAAELPAGPRGDWKGDKKFGGTLMSKEEMGRGFRVWKIPLRFGGALT